MDIGQTCYPEHSKIILRFQLINWLTIFNSIHCFWGVFLVLVHSVPRRFLDKDQVGEISFQSHPCAAT